MNAKTRTRIADSITNPSAHVSRRGLANVVDEIIDKTTEALARLGKRIKELEARTQTVEAKGLEYRGTWSRASTYTRGSICTHSGALWICSVDSTNDKPGGSDAWTLAAKSTK